MWPDGTSRLLGMGCMRLSTERDRDETRAIAVLHAALDAGVTFLDTADAYCWDAGEAGHNERLIARALATWPGDQSRILIGTKGGLTRPRGGWVADGRGRHLLAACAASRVALGTERLALYQLHVPDPRTPLTTSVRALDSLKRDGLVEAIGLCNVKVRQIEEARNITEIATVQVEISPWRADSILNGVAAYCAANGIRLLAHRPLGGADRRRRVAFDPVLMEVAARHGVTPFDIALAWLADLSDAILPIPGPTGLDTARSLARLTDIHLTDDDRAQLDERFQAGQLLRANRSARPGVARTDPPPDTEIVLIMGLPGAGKSTLAHTLVDRRYTRLNRDEAGGSVNQLLPALDRLIADGCSRIVLDNTYVTREARAPVVHAAAKRGLPVRCIWLSTSVEDAQINAVSRMLSRYGRLLGPDEMRRARRQAPNVFAPGVQFRYQRELEPPEPAEGFSRIDVEPFVRRRDASYMHRAVIVWCDGVLWRSRAGHRAPSSEDDVEVAAERGVMLGRYEAEGWRVLGLSWQPDISEKSIDPREVVAAISRMQERLGVRIEVEYCPHGGGPPACWCRKPLPGLGVVFIERHRLDPSRCLYIGAGPLDPGFARRLGFQYRDVEDFFGV